MLPPREPAGDTKLAEQAETVEQAWSLLLDLEDVDFLHEQDKVRTIEFVRKATEHIELSRQPCDWFDRLFNRRGCR